MTIDELLEELKSAVRQNRLGSHRDDIELIEKEIIERVHPTVDIEDEEEDYDNYDNDNLLDIYVDLLDEPGNEYLSVEEKLLERMKECDKLRHGRKWNEYSDITDRDLLSLFEDEILSVDEKDLENYRNEILRRMQNCMYIGH